MVALTWTISLLLNHQMELKKAQYDIKNLVHLQAIVKETLRLYPPSPIITLRAVTNNCTFSCGYHIPAGTQLMVNVRKIHRDGRLWTDPHDFKPERFLTSNKDIDVRSRNYELVPFGSGRSMSWRLIGSESGALDID